MCIYSVAASADLMCCLLNDAVSTLDIDYVLSMPLTHMYVEGIKTLSFHKAKKLALPAVTNSRKAKIPACRYLIYSRIAEISARRFRKNVKNNIVSGSSGSANPMLWELRGERVK